MDEGDNDYFNLAYLVKMKMQLIAVGVKLQFENGCNVFTTSILHFMWQYFTTKWKKKIAKHSSQNTGIVLLL